MAKKAYIETYGCQMNVSDTELMHAVLADHGYLAAEDPGEADVILVNSCAIRDHAEQRVLGRLGQLQQYRESRPGLKIGVTGCMAQRMGDTLLAKSGGLDLVVGPDGYRRLPQALAKLDEELASGSVPASKRAPAAMRLTVLDFDPHENYQGVRPRRTSVVSAWVPVQRGCNYRCTYCIVPYVRGSEKNRAPGEILAEVRELAADGVPEVVLLGQTVNSYRHGDWDFSRLLREVAGVRGVRRVRFTSPHPNDFTPELVEVMASQKVVCDQLHLPVQSGHDRTLKRMLRRYTVAEYREKITWVRERIPHVSLSTDVIAGFPGETGDEFEATLELMREVRFDDAFMYKFSLREGTPATRFPAADFIPEREAQRRLERLIKVQREIQLGINRAQLGRVEEVLVEKEARRGGLQGRTEGNKVVAFAGPAEWIGRFMEVRLTGTTGATFTGERAAGAEPRAA
ncbi:MAG: tRNA (N6-isopentenyl adenosine(37)-C2)-methylthiotransferase MiaB [Longimicrobiaceae bacterium]